MFHEFSQSFGITQKYVMVSPQFYYLNTLFPGQFEDKLPKGNELT